MLLLSLEEEYLDSSISHVYVCMDFTSSKNGFIQFDSRTLIIDVIFESEKNDGVTRKCELMILFILGGKYFEFELVKKNIALVL
jgi:hypothetical protein